VAGFGFRSESADEKNQKRNQPDFTNLLTLGAGFVAWHFHVAAVQAMLI
jgi:hypothetical protein